MYVPFKNRMPKEKLEYAAELRKNPTASEKLLWKKLRMKGIGCEFKQSVPMLGYIADFYCHKHRLVVELDGCFHNGREEYDWNRDQVMTRHGLTVLRIASSRVFSDMDSVIADIKAAIRQRIIIGFPLTIAGKSLHEWV